MKSKETDDIIANFLCALTSNENSLHDEDLDLDKVQRDLARIIGRLKSKTICGVENPIFCSLANFTSRQLFGYPVLCYITRNTGVVKKINYGGRTLEAVIRPGLFITVDIPEGLETLTGLISPSFCNPSLITFSGIIFT